MFDGTCLEFDFHEITLHILIEFLLLFLIVAVNLSILLYLVCKKKQSPVCRKQPAVVFHFILGLLAVYFATSLGTDLVRIRRQVCSLTDRGGLCRGKLTSVLFYFVPRKIRLNVLRYLGDASIFLN